MTLGIVVLVEDFELIRSVMLSDGKTNWPASSPSTKISIPLLSSGSSIQSWTTWVISNISHPSLLKSIVLDSTSVSITWLLLKSLISTSDVRVVARDVCLNSFSLALDTALSLVWSSGCFNSGTTNSFNLFSLDAFSFPAKIRKKTDEH